MFNIYVGVICSFHVHADRHAGVSRNPFNAVFIQCSMLMGVYIQCMYMNMYKQGTNAATNSKMLIPDLDWEMTQKARL